jgi:hypothetical protein
MVPVCCCAVVEPLLPVVGVVISSDEARPA